eukprot:12501953-Heterocapsa_arctica.AAC.1
MQSGLLRKFLNYDEVSRDNFPQSDLVMAILRDITSLAASYSKALKIVDALGMVVVIFVLQLVKQ